MSGFFNSFLPVIKKTKKFRRYWIEIILIIAAAIIGFTSLYTYQNSVDRDSESSKNRINFAPIIADKIDNLYVDVSGSVVNPGLYEASQESRLNDIIIMAGGLSDSADKIFFAKYFNLARIVSDQEKIYIPSVQDVNDGYHIEKVPSVKATNSSDKSVLGVTDDSRININYATPEELDTLPGVGKVTVQKIIDNRPFGALDELINDKIVNKNVYENIKDLIEI